MSKQRDIAKDAYEKFLLAYGPHVLRLVQDDRMIEAVISVVNYEVALLKESALQAVLAGQSHESLKLASKADAQIEFLGALNRVSKQYAALGNPKDAESNG